MDSTAFQQGTLARYEDGQRKIEAEIASGESAEMPTFIGQSPWTVFFRMSRVQQGAIRRLIGPKIILFPQSLADERENAQVLCDALETLESDQ